MLSTQLLEFASLSHNLSHFLSCCILELDTAASAMGSDFKLRLPSGDATLLEGQKNRWTGGLESCQAPTGAPWKDWIDFSLESSLERWEGWCRGFKALDHCSALLLETGERGAKICILSSNFAWRRGRLTSGVQLGGNSRNGCWA